MASNNRDNGCGRLLQLQNITVGNDSTPLIKNLDLCVNQGEFVALLGPSGCGKTTLLRAISGLIDPMEGTVLLRKEPAPCTTWPEFRRRVVLIQQTPVLLDSSVRHNLQKPFQYQSANEQDFPQNKAVELLNNFGVDPSRMDQNAQSLSVGQQQRVCLIRALLLQPEVLLLDEPTSALDPEAVRSVEDLFVTEARHRGLSALLVTHDRSQAKRICDRSVSLNEYLTREARIG
ncbi:MAG: ATP-binding cassette domain-containing protein [Candidatus Aegiribacteria sp.]|nr:ATP-binding cassette domain-containing protein [Candidatus Aegiribacteria sp.]